MGAIDCDARLTLDDLYVGYVEACGELEIAPLPPDHLLALLQSLAERDTPTLH